MSATVRFKYNNYKSDISDRFVAVECIEYIADPSKVSKHLASYAPGWFITGMDLDKNQVRSFALSHMVSVGGVLPRILVEGGFGLPIS